MEIAFLKFQMESLQSEKSMCCFDLGLMSLHED